MKPRTETRRTPGIALLVASVILAACESADSPVAIDVEGAPDAPSMIVSGVVTLPAAAGAGGTASGPSLSGVLVTLEGTAALDTTDVTGAFRLQAPASAQLIRLRFRSGATDALLEVEGGDPGVVIHVEVYLDDGGVSLLSSSRNYGESPDDDEAGQNAEFKGVATLVTVSGTEPSRVLRIAITAEDGSTAEVELTEGVTVFDNEGDFVAFADVLAALEAATPLDIEGRGTVQDDGSIAAATAKAETDGPDDDEAGQNAEFKGGKPGMA